MLLIIRIEISESIEGMKYRNTRTEDETVKVRILISEIETRRVIL